MKHNLKTLKKMYETVVHSATIPNILRLGTELNDFEAKQRKDIDNAFKEKSKLPISSFDYSFFYLGYIKAKKEILGEEK